MFIIIIIIIVIIYFFIIFFITIIIKHLKGLLNKNKIFYCEVIVQSDETFMKYLVNYFHNILSSLA